MIIEVAEFQVRPGEGGAFEAAMTQVLRSITARAQGFVRYSFTRGVESPERYLLQVTWEKIDDHMVTFRGSPEREQWRALVEPFYAERPRMEHFAVVAAS